MSESDPERTLADAPDEPQQPIYYVDSSVTPTPENFDIDEWIAGVRPTRRSVRLVANGHLVARLEEIADQIERAPEDADVDDLIDQYDAIKAQVREGVWFTLEKRSSEWVYEFLRSTCASLGYPAPERGDQPLGKLTTEQRIEVVLRQVAAQTVVPQGLTAGHLQRMLDANEGELNKLVLTMDAVNSTLAESAGVMDRDFSGRRSSGRQASSQTSGSRSTRSASRRRDT
jgi:hypothetical protein